MVHTYDSGMESNIPEVEKISSEQCAILGEFKVCNF